MMKVYGSKVSYFTGKLEAYLRYKAIPYELIPLPPHRAKILAQTGAVQFPVVEREDGRWMSDTTPILRQLEGESPVPPIFPEDPTVRFIALVIEDYADEWLWRPAMHYRWSYAHDRELLSSLLVDELMEGTRLPRFVNRRLIQARQRGGFVLGDGVNAQTRDHVEAGYFRALTAMSELLEKRPFLLGDSPSIADFGLMGPMLRHFSQDPTPAELMRRHGPGVYAWTARVWHATPLPAGPNFVQSIPDEARSLLAEICQTHLAQLSANSEAWAKTVSQGKGRGEKRLGHFAMTIQGCQYKRIPVSRYRVACLEELRRAFSLLPEASQSEVRALLQHAEADILWASDLPATSGYDEERRAPFGRAINVFGKGVPPLI